MDQSDLVRFYDFGRVVAVDQHQVVPHLQFELLLVCRPEPVIHLLPCHLRTHISVGTAQLTHQKLI